MTTPQSSIASEPQILPPRRQPFTLRKGMFFKADEALRKLEPHAEWWQILRPLSTTTIFGEQRIDNKRHNLWMCCPEGWLGRVEVICVFDNPNPDNFFFNRDPLVDAILKARKNYQRIEL